MHTLVRLAAGLVLVLASGGPPSDSPREGLAGGPASGDAPDRRENRAVTVLPRFTLASTHPEPTARAAAFFDFFGSCRPGVFVAARGQLPVIRSEGGGLFRRGGTRNVDNGSGRGAQNLDADGPRRPARASRKPPWWPR